LLNKNKSDIVSENNKNLETEQGLDISSSSKYPLLIGTYACMHCMMDGSKTTTPMHRVRTAGMREVQASKKNQFHMSSLLSSQQQGRTQMNARGPGAPLYTRRRNVDALPSADLMDALAARQPTRTRQT